MYPGPLENLHKVPPQMRTDSFPCCFPGIVVDHWKIKDLKQVVIKFGDDTYVVHDSFLLYLAFFSIFISDLD